MRWAIIGLFAIAFFVASKQFDTGALLMGQVIGVCFMLAIFFTDKRE